MGLSFSGSEILILIAALALGLLVLIGFIAISKITYPKSVPVKSKRVYPAQKLYSAEVLDVKRLNPITIELFIKLSENQDFKYLAGQFISLKVSDTAYRAYSISSNPINSTQIQLIATIAHEGVGSNYLRNLKPHDALTFIGPAGRFILPDQLSNELVFVVTGTGIAPVFPMLEELKTNGYLGKINLYWGIRHESDLFHLEKLEEYKNNFASFNLNICISDPVNNTSYKTGRLTKYFKSLLHPRAQFFVCGNPNMVSEIVEQLNRDGVASNAVFHEKFTVASSSK